MERFKMNSKIKLEKQELGHRPSSSKPINIKTERTQSFEQAISIAYIPKKVKQESKVNVQRRNTVDVVTNDRGNTIKHVKCESIKFIRSVSLCEDSKPKTKFTEPLPLPKTRRRRRSDHDSALSPSHSSTPRKLNVFKDPNAAGYEPRQGNHRHEHQRKREIDMYKYQHNISPGEMDSDDEYELLREIRADKRRC